MIAENKLAAAIRAVQDVIIVARSFAGEGASKEKMYYFLDIAENLPGLISEEKDRTELFELCLKSISEEYDCPHVWIFYNKRINGHL